MSFWPIVIFLVVSLSVLNACSKVDTSKEQVVRGLHDALHVGQSKEEVETLLKRHSIEYSFDPAKQQLTGIIRDVASDAIVHKSIQIIIRFDADGHVIHVAMPERLTGP